MASNAASLHNVSIAIVGAGPYGLSIAAHLRRDRARAHLLGRPMDFWRNMPAGLKLKSPWSASSLADPDRAYTLDRYVRRHHLGKAEPVPLALFLDYARWFQDHAAGEVEEVEVRCLARERRRFRLELSDGRTLHPGKVIVATGIAPFPHVPDFAAHLPPAACSHTQHLRDPRAFAGREVVVVGAGQSALEYAALLHEAGARVELVARGRVIWADRRLHEWSGPARRLFYPPADVGPVGINWLVAAPGLVRRLPWSVRWDLGVRAVRPGGAKWLRHRVESRFRVTGMTPVLAASVQGDRVRLDLGDGSQRLVDHLLLGTGYRPALARVGFIDPALKAEVAVDGRGYPRLDGCFQSSVPGLYFVGAFGAGSFGPLCRFVAGARFASKRVAAHAAA